MLENKLLFTCFIKDQVKIQENKNRLYKRTIEEDGL